MILALVAFLKPRWVRLTVVSMNSFVSLMMLATAIYASYFGRILTPRMLIFIDQLWAVRGSIGNLLHPGLLLFCADLIIFGVWTVWRRTRKNGPPEQLIDRRRPITALVLVLSAALVIGQSVSAATLDDRVDDVLVARERGLLAYQASQPFMPEEPLITKAMADELGLDIMDPASVQNAIDTLTGGQEGERIADFEPGAFEGMNVILIQFESLQEFVIGSRVEPSVVTPNFNALIDESWYFPNAYSQIGRGNTSDAEFVTNTSLYASALGACSELYDHLEIPSMPRLFTAEGYEALTFHTNVATFWNRRAMYKSLGFTRFYDQEFFGTEDYVGRFGSSDQVLYDKTLPELVRLNDEGTKFYAQIITLTSHHPFEELDEAHTVIDLPERFDGTMIGNYLSSVAYADREMGRFIDGLKESGLWDNSIVIAYGDHNGLREMEPEGADLSALQEVLGRDYNLSIRTNIPLAIHVPGQTEGVIVDAPAVQGDLMPTITGMLGLDTSSTPMFGRDLFVDTHVSVPMRGRLALGSFLNDRILYMADYSYVDGSAFAADGQNSARFFEVDEVDFENGHLLLRLNDAYLESLSGLSDYAPDPESNIPTRK
jgi:lipoteichoic acid synthase